MKTNLILMPVRVNKEHLKKAKKIGRGNRSKGVRKALDSYEIEQSKLLTLK